MSVWIWVAILVIPAGFLRLVGHELSHAVAAIVTGGEVQWDAFRPWPHKIARADGVRRWVWGSMRRTGGDPFWIYIAPAGKATALAVSWAVPAALAWTPLWVFAAWELTDVVWWLVGWIWRPYSDGGIVRARLDGGDDG